MQEKRLEKMLREKIKTVGGLALKFTSPGYTGVPDRIILLPGGKHYFVELKSSGQKLRHRQVCVKKQFEKLGHEVYVIDSKDTLYAFLEEVTNADKR